MGHFNLPAIPKYISLYAAKTVFQRIEQGPLMSIIIMGMAVQQNRLLCGRLKAGKQQCKR